MSKIEKWRNGKLDKNGKMIENDRIEKWTELKNMDKMKKKMDQKWTKWKKLKKNKKNGKKLKTRSKRARTTNK